ncbi:MAG: hypothetical protein HYU85_06610 [Chloroflexi bacterium]|nr:hypothetical protein [Chloroflexota bacterium]MBI3040486.1 hypothetical protein [Chloroflexota bacterium]MBI3930986.1 hypothetical protein [Chloroflexota bacterium]
MNYKDEVTQAMDMLAANKKVIFLGQSVRYSGHVMYGTLQNISKSRRIELPVFEDVQMGMSIGLSLTGFIPVSIFPRMDFLIIATNQLINHLDKIEQMSCGQFKPKVIIRTMIGSTTPLNPGPQHSQNHIEALKHLLTNVDIYQLDDEKYIVPAYHTALEADRSSILVEFGDLY